MSLKNTDKIYFDALDAVYMVDCTVYLFLSHMYYGKAWDLVDEFSLIMKNYYLGETF